MTCSVAGFQAKKKGVYKSVFIDFHSEGLKGPRRSINLVSDLFYFKAFSFVFFFFFLPCMGADIAGFCCCVSPAICRSTREHALNNDSWSVRGKGRNDQ